MNQRSVPALLRIYSLRYFPQLLVVWLTFCLAGICQNSTGRIIGTVTDPQGASVVGARVRVTNTGTNVERTTVTDNTGSYQVLNLPIGMYTVSVESQGFTTAVTQAQELTINQSLRIDVRMKVGGVTQVVEVQSQSAQVETVNPTIGGTVTGKPIQDLPLNGREVLDLAFTQPGVLPAPTTGYGSEKSGEFSEGFTVAGGRPDAVTYLLDGGLNNSVTSNNVVFDPNPDTVAEFRILTNNYTAEYGRNGGGTVTVVTRSGTNGLHGSVFDYLRNDAFNANDYFDNELGQPRPVLKRNQFGGTFGGPIIKDRLFYFFGYQGQRQTSITHGQAVTTYTPAELDGNFSQAVNGGPDPNVVAYLKAHPYFQSNPGLARQGIINPSKIDPVAQAYIKAGLVPTSPTGQLFPEGRALDNVNQYTGKLDFYATPTDRLSLTIGSNQEPTELPLGVFATVLGFPSDTSTTNQFLNLAYTKTLSPSLLNEAHATANRFYQTSSAGSQPPNPAALGVNINSDLPFAPPIIQLDSSNLVLGFDPNLPRTKADNTYGISDTLTWTRGRHTIKTGGRFAILQENSVYAYATNGWFFFYGTQTTVGSGTDLADFLFGAPDEYQQYPRANNNEHQKQYALFAQDEWKVTPRLVLTLGLRWEYTSPETDIHGHTFDIIPGLHSTRFENAPPGLVVPGDPGAPTGWYFPDHRDFAPRFGFAWDPFGNGKTSVRGGAGMFYDTLNGWMSDWNNGVLPWWSSSDLFFGATPANGPNASLSLPYQHACVFDVNGNCEQKLGQPDPFPSSTPPRNLNFATAGYLPFGFGDLFVDPHLKTPYIYQYNLSVQRQLGNSLMAEVSYVGSSSHKLLTWVDINPIIPSTCAQPTGCNRLLNTQLGLTPANGYAPLQDTFEGLNNANYNGLLASLTKRTGNWRNLGEMYFNVSYTWSHNFDNGSGFNQRSMQIPYFNPHQFYGSADFDMRNRIEVSGGWDLPFDHLWSSGPKRLTSGWSLYPIAYYQSGIPLDFYADTASPDESDPGPSGYGDPQLIRPDQVTPTIQTFDPHKLQTLMNPNAGVQTTGNFLFNPADLVANPCINTETCPVGYYGTYRRDSLAGPTRFNFDLALEKATDLVGERLKMMFRVEAFNILNHTQFQNPGSTQVSDPNLGVISTTFDPRILQLALRFTF